MKGINQKRQKKIRKVIIIIKKNFKHKNKHIKNKRL